MSRVAKTESTFRSGRRVRFLLTVAGHHEMRIGLSCNNDYLLKPVLPVQHNSSTVTAVNEAHKSLSRAQHVRFPRQSGRQVRAKG